jgi:hypothetical protein
LCYGHNSNYTYIQPMCRVELHHHLGVGLYKPPPVTR